MMAMLVDIRRSLQWPVTVTDRPEFRQQVCSPCLDRHALRVDLLTERFWRGCRYYIEYDQTEVWDCRGRL